MGAHRVLGVALPGSSPSQRSPPACTVHLELLLPSAPWQPALGFLWLWATQKCSCRAQENCPPLFNFLLWSSSPSASPPTPLVWDISHFSLPLGRVSVRAAAADWVVMLLQAWLLSASPWKMPCGSQQWCSMAISSSRQASLEPHELDISFWLSEGPQGSEVKCVIWQSCAVVIQMNLGQWMRRGRISKQPSLEWSGNKFKQLCWFKK